jgi:hypothetical protein
VVAREAAERVVDLLEVVEVEEDEGHRATVALRARDLALERLQEVALVEDLREPVGGRELVDRLVVAALDVVAREELKKMCARS